MIWIVGEGERYYCTDDFGWVLIYLEINIIFGLWYFIIRVGLFVYSL